MRWFLLCCFPLYLLAGSSDSISPSRKWLIGATYAGIGGATYIGLNQAWYAQYERSSFHFFNDNSEWLQMDKAGHLLSSYHVGQFGYNTFLWAGIKKRNALWVGGSLGTMYLSIIEILDGYSKGWGFSWGDMAANATGSLFFISQECLWDEQRITPKFSAHLTDYASYRPGVLGQGEMERLLKDYNGQTYWFSVNLKSFWKKSQIPKWLSVSFGYSSDGLISGKPEHPLLFDRRREFVFSLDADLWRIDGIKSKFWKSFLRTISFIKIPFPALVLTGGKVDGKIFYF